MNYSFKQAINYTKSDLIRYGVIPNRLNIFLQLLFGNHAYKFSFWLRMCGSRNIFFYFSKIIYTFYRDKYNLQIPYTTKVGYGLYLGHGVNIVINKFTIIGNNCNISHCVTIGSNSENAAIIGDNVYIGPNVCIVENVNIGNNVTIGAGAVVVKDVTADYTVAGNPARIISNKEPGRFIKNRYLINQ